MSGPLPAGGVHFPCSPNSETPLSFRSVNSLDYYESTNMLGTTAPVTDNGCCSARKQKQHNDATFCIDKNMSSSYLKKTTEDQIAALLNHSLNNFINSGSDLVDNKNDASLVDDNVLDLASYLCAKRAYEERQQLGNMINKSEEDEDEFVDREATEEGEDKNCVYLQNIPHYDKADQCVVLKSTSSVENYVLPSNSPQEDNSGMRTPQLLHSPGKQLSESDDYPSRCHKSQTNDLLVFTDDDFGKLMYKKKKLISIALLSSSSSSPYGLSTPSTVNSTPLQQTRLTKKNYHDTNETSDITYKKDTEDYEDFLNLTPLPQSPRKSSCSLERKSNLDMKARASVSPSFPENNILKDFDPSLALSDEDPTSFPANNILNVNSFAATHILPSNSSNNSDITPGVIGPSDITSSQFNAVLSFFHPKAAVENSTAFNETLDCSGIVKENDRLFSPENETVSSSSSPGVVVATPLSSKKTVEIFSLSSTDNRPAANVPEQQLEDVKKFTIYVIFENTCTPVSWCSDMTIKDVREMILCACDAMIDSGFVLREVIEVDKRDELTIETVVNNKTLLYKCGRRFEFEEMDQLTPGGTYTLQKASERADLKKITGDRWRKLRVRIASLLHVEAIKAIAVMKRGANLLKHTEMGFPHLRQFQLSSDCQRLLWYSSSDINRRTSIEIKSIKEIRLGQQSPLFRAYKLPSLEHLSFSIFYESLGPIPKALVTLIPQMNHQSTLPSLDITCKDEVEYDHWICGLKALVFHANNLYISKEELLSHSKRFRVAVENCCPGVTLVSSPPPKEPGRQGLEDCLDLPVHSIPDLAKKLERLQINLVKAERRMEQFDQQYNLHGELNVTTLSNESDVLDFGFTMSSLQQTSEETIKKEAQSSIYKDVSNVEDDKLEYRRMRELQLAVVELLHEAKRVIGEAMNAQQEGGSSKKINQLLWKAEVDIENIDDMLSRLRERRENSIEKSLGRLFSKIKNNNAAMNEGLQRVGDQISTTFMSLLNAPSTSSPSTLSSI